MQSIEMFEASKNKFRFDRAYIPACESAERNARFN